MVTPNDKKMADELKFPEELGNGPIQKRWITDVFCGIMYWIAMLAFVVACFYGFQNGEIKNLFIGWDYDGNGCGYSSATKDYPYLYWPEPPNTQMLDQLKQKPPNFQAFKTLLAKTVCVKQCPMKNGTIECKAPTFMTANNNGGGKYANCQAKDQAGNWFRYDTYTVADSFCLPNGKSYVNENTFKTIKGAFQSSIYGKTAARWVMNVAQAWQIMIVGAVVALVLGYLYLFVIRLIGGAIIWVSFIIVVLALAGGGLWTFFIKRKEYLPETNEVYKYLTYGSYVLWGLSALSALLMLCCYNSIKIGIAVFKTTAQYIQANMHIFLLPFVGFICCTLWYALWFGGSISVFATGVPAPREAPFQFLTEIKWTDMTKYIFFFQVFMLFWINAFMIGCTEFIIGCSACIWYFECTSDTKGRGTVTKGLKWLLRYHIGSIAFGAFVIAVCQMIRFLFEYYRKKIQSAHPTKLVKALLCLTGYLLYLMDKCVKFITKNAYIQVALTCDSFCRAAWNSFALIIKNADRFGAGLSIGTVFNVFGIGCIMALTGGSGYLFMTSYSQVVQVDDPIPPTVALCIVSGVIGAMFLSIFSYSTDAIMQAFLLDESLRFLGNARPAYMTEFAEALKKRGQGSCEWNCC